MSYSPFSLVSAEIRQRAANIRLACFDVDGTLTDGRLYYDDNGGEFKAFHVRDGQGLALLRRFGFAVALITARTSLAVEKRAADLDLIARTGVQDKLSCLRRLCEQHDITFGQVAFMGDDLPDFECLQNVGLAIAPADAHPWIGDIVHWKTRARGGEGAVREACDLLLEAHDHLDTILGVSPQ
ncbi:MAG: HAD-IIIA family hydrolase [Xanthomonadaceae bacterium]|nr:HAD-IIIA family hydrolase [Xanthomonadaceae bacterium]